MHNTDARSRHLEILEIINEKSIATQQEIAAALSKRGFAATQSSVSRDIVRLGLAKLNGVYVAPESAVKASGPVSSIDTAGQNLIVIKTDVGLAQPAALTIDRAHIDQIVGTVAGDDTILVAVKNETAQRLALKKIIELFAPRGASSRSRRKRNANSIAAASRRLENHAGDN